MDNNEPEKLYRYFPLGPDNKTWFDRVRDTLENQRLYCPCPTQLNDPFDCAIKLANGDSDREAGIQGRIDKQAGVVSFSACGDHVLMWSHYASHHRGICLEFDMPAWPPEDREGYVLDKVRYTMSRPLPTLSPQEQAGAITLEKIAFTKHKNWCYENEWRMVCSFKNRCDPYLGFPRAALTGVIFGLKMTDNDRCVMEQVIRDAGYQGLTIFEAREDHDKFCVKVCPVLLPESDSPTMTVE